MTKLNMAPNKDQRKQLDNANRDILELKRKKHDIDIEVSKIQQVKITIIQYPKDGYTRKYKTGFKF